MQSFEPFGNRPDAFLLSDLLLQLTKEGQAGGAKYIFLELANRRPWI